MKNRTTLRRLLYLVALSKARKREAENNPDDACKIDEIVYSGVDGSDYQSNDTVNQDARHKV